MEEPMGFFIARTYKDPFYVLISCLLSLRSRDTVTLPISQNLFVRVTSPQEMLDIPLQELEEIIRPIGFFHQKARTLKHVSAELLHRFGGRVPNTETDLLSIKGVGRKTANLVLGLSFGIPAICVDTHVHRLSNQLGLVSTKTPEETEEALKQILPERDWIEFNNLLVAWGQNIPRSKQVSLLEHLLKAQKP
jgi:endonuclease-3